MADQKQLSSPYESIYEPINSRPPSQMSNRSNNYPAYSLSSASAYANGGSSINGSNLHLVAPVNNPTHAVPVSCSGFPVHLAELCGG